MRLYKLSQLQFKERFKFVEELKESDTELPPDVKIVKEIFDDTIEWFKKQPNPSDPNLITKLKDTKVELPSIFETIYEIMEKSKIEKLPTNERSRIFTESKEGWKELYSDFGRISNIMEYYKTNEMLIEYAKKSPPTFIHDEAIAVYKKCISFKVKFSKKIVSHLIQNPNTLHIHYYNGRIYCIKEDKVKDFLKEYQEWNLKMCNLWNTIYSLKDKFYSLYAYEDWKWYIKHNNLLKGKADEIQKIQDDALSLLIVGKEIVLKHDNVITTEYETNAYEMSLYERELEIMQLSEGESAADEEYCYVYTLECELFVFYVGIAANPKERFEQHIRGAFSDEAHLFKSKFIQKYHKEVKQNLVYEGIRSECKKFEKEYISKFRPLGNMTEGGEG
jgi:hypothetical protein